MNKFGLMRHTSQPDSLKENQLCDIKWRRTLPFSTLAHSLQIAAGENIVHALSLLCCAVFMARLLLCCCRILFFLWFSNIIHLCNFDFILSSHNSIHSPFFLFRAFFSRLAYIVFTLISAIIRFCHILLCGAFVTAIEPSDGWDIAQVNAVLVQFYCGGFDEINRGLRNNSCA